MKKLTLILTVFGFILTAEAQQLTSVTQYIDNQYLINPGVAGSLPYSPLSLTYKRLWSGFDNAPEMEMISSHVLIADNMGLGGKIFNYSTGALSKTGIEGTYSYHLRVGSSGKLALGLSLQLYQFHFDKSKITMEEQDDDVLLYGSEKLMVPDAAFGAYYYASNYFVGLSSYQLFNRKVDLMTDDILENRQVRHYYMVGGYNYDINGNFSVEPSVLVKFIESGIVQADINARAIYRQTAWLGIGYRTQDAIGVSIGMRKDRLMFGYAYDIVLSDIKKHSVGSHELMFIFKFNRSKPKL